MVRKISKIYFRRDLTGQRFGRLLAKEYVKGSRWICQCDCGNMVTVRAWKLLSGNTVSCKCYRNTLLAKERTLGKGYASFREVMRQYTRTADKKGLVFELLEDVCYKMMQERCFYCNSEPYAVKKHRECFGDFVYNGIDRVDSSKGYISGNVVTCCKRCNYAKNDMTLIEFSVWLEKIYSNKNHWMNK